MVADNSTRIGENRGKYREAKTKTNTKLKRRIRWGRSQATLV